MPGSRRPGHLVLILGRRADHHMIFHIFSISFYHGFFIGDCSKFCVKKMKSTVLWPLASSAVFVVSITGHKADYTSHLRNLNILPESSYYRKRGSASYIVREVLSVREREREIQTDRERERDGSDVTIVALKLAMNTLSLAKNSHNWR